MRPAAAPAWQPLQPALRPHACRRAWRGAAGGGCRPAGATPPAVVPGAALGNAAAVHHPVLADEVVTRTLAFGQRRQHFVRRLAAVERRDQRLHDAHRAVVGAHVAPRFEEVRFRNVPVTERRGLVLVETEVRAHGDLLQRLVELQIDRRRVDRIAAEDEQELDRAGVHLADQLAQRRALIDRLQLRRSR